MVGDKKDEPPFFMNLTDTPALCAKMCVKLGRLEEAMDWLEEMIQYNQIVKKNYNVEIESKLPFFFKQRRSFHKQSYEIGDKLTSILWWSDFDPLRETDRFKAIYTSAEKLENTN